MRADKLVYSSDWAAQSAQRDYEADSNRIEVISFGANLDEVPLLEVATLSKQTDICRLLLVGRSWERKGGAIAYQTLLSLLERGIEAELTIVGCVPPAQFQHPKLTVIPFLDKHHPQQRKKLEQLLLESNFLVFPTQADCSPIAICEASAFGLPVLTSNVGGIPSLIQDGINGYLLPPSATGADYADRIAQVFADRSEYRQLSAAARREYDTRLNWNHWAKSVYAVMVETLARPEKTKVFDASQPRPSGTVLRPNAAF